MPSDDPRTVFLVGAGPGDPRLITLAAGDALQTADVVLYDRLVAPALLQLAPDAERIDVGKTPGGATTAQDAINALMIEHARRGRRVVRLKGGDPFVFGRGGEEAAALAAAGVPMQIVPGVTSATAAAAAVGIAVTDRRAASAVTIVSGAESDGDAPPINWDALAAVGGTIVVLMGWRNLDVIVQRLIEAGLPSDTPAAAVEHAWTSAQRAVFAPLHQLAQHADGMAPPITIIIGETVRLATPEVAWTIPGRRILVTRAREQAASLVRRLRAFNAHVIELPAIAIQPNDPADFADALQRLAAGRYDIVVFTSVNGVQQLWDALRQRGLDARVFAKAQVAAIGSETARALDTRGITPDVVPDTYTSAALADTLTRDRLSSLPSLHGQRILLARAARANPLLPARLRDAGAIVDDAPLYRVVTPPPNPAALEALERGVDVVTLTSPSTADGLADLIGERIDLHSLQTVCIGPVTAAAAAQRGFSIVGVAETHTMEGLAQAVGRYLVSLPPMPEDAPESAATT